MTGPCDLSAARRFDLSPWIRADNGPGAVVAVLSGGEVQSWAARGRAAVGAEAPQLTLQTAFYAASVAKQFTAACVTQCEVAGVLNVDASVRTYIPELPTLFQPVTLRHLLHHLGGLRRGWDLIGAQHWPANWWEGRGLWELIAVLADEPALLAPPGEAHLYSNAGYWLLAACVERASGMPFAAFAQQTLFEPLGMQASRFRDDPDALQPGLVVGHRLADYGYQPVHTRFHGVGDGGLLTTIEDLARWDLFWSGGSHLGLELPTRLQARGRRTDGAWLYYARGISLRSHRELPIISHGGSFLGYLSKLVRFPDQDFSIACLANAGDIDVDALSMALADLVLGDQGDPEAPSWAETVREDALAP
jgi:CubicO group peptidase (beta-lactamase class C family)